ncbi:MAG: hypothetical protein DRO40_06160 [Thermoprotei archaeon]|nr:MAG: hypothetical protein DRO40_06160 [Thermoprotei archaeon]
MLRRGYRIIGDFGELFIASILIKMGSVVRWVGRGRKSFDLFVEKPEGELIKRRSYVEVKTRRLSRRSYWKDIPPSLEDFNRKKSLAEKENCDYILAFVFYDIAKDNGVLKLWIKSYIVDSRNIDETWFIERKYRGKIIKQISIKRILSLKPSEAIIIETIQQIK